MSQYYLYAIREGPNAGMKIPTTKTWYSELLGFFVGGGGEYTATKGKKLAFRSYIAYA